MTQPAVKRLFWDIEVSPNVVLSWRLGYKVMLLPDSLIQERAIICICWKWEGSKEVKAVQWNAFHDDKEAIKEFLKDAVEADEMVAHNGDRFDAPWLRARALFHKIGPLPKFKTVDTLAWAKRLFYFNSNKLDYIAKFLGLGGKIETKYDLWKGVLRDDPKALAQMVTYCKRDVTLLEQVWKRLSEAAEAKTHAGVKAGYGKVSCPHCGSPKVQSRGLAVTAGGTTHRRLQCQVCGKWSKVLNTIYENTIT